MITLGLCNRTQGRISYTLQTNVHCTRLDSATLHKIRCPGSECSISASALDPARCALPPMRRPTQHVDLAGCTSRWHRASMGIISKVWMHQHPMMTVLAKTLTSMTQQLPVVVKTWTMISPNQQDPAPALEQQPLRRLLRSAGQLGSMALSGQASSGSRLWQAS